MVKICGKMVGTNSGHKKNLMPIYVLIVIAVCAILFLGLIFTNGHKKASEFSATQNKPTLALAKGNAGITGDEGGKASNFEFYMEASGWPRAVTAGETVLMMGSWPTGSNPTITDDKSNTWSSAISCGDSTGITHGFFYAVNAASNTSVITETYASQVDDGVFDLAHFFNMSTNPSGFLDGSSCNSGITPSNNTVPNIKGTAYTTTTNGDLIVICVYVDQNPLAAPDPIASITWPAGFNGLSEDTTYGHACAYGVQATAGSFTPTFTVAQNSGHNTFTIVSAAFKAGTGGTPPPLNKASVLLSEMHYTQGAGQTDTVYLPCPTGTTSVAALDEAGSMVQRMDLHQTISLQREQIPMRAKMYLG